MTDLPHQRATRRAPRPLHSWALGLTAFMLTGLAILLDTGPLIA